MDLWTDVAFDYIVVYLALDVYFSVDSIFLFVLVLKVTNLFLRYYWSYLWNFNDYVGHFEQNCEGALWVSNLWILFIQYGISIWVFIMYLFLLLVYLISFIIMLIRCNIIIYLPYFKKIVYVKIYMFNILSKSFNYNNIVKIIQKLIKISFNCI